MAIRAIGANVNSVTFGKNEKTDKVLARKSTGSAMQEVLYWVIIASITIANLFAIRQQNLKRFMAFSAISQAGYIMLGVIGGSADGMTALVYYVLVYLAANMGVFAVISIIEQRSGKLEMDDYNGLYQSNPKLAFLMLGVIGGSADGMTALVYYVLVYLAANMGVFAVISIIEQRSGKLEMDDYNGLYQSNPKLAFLMTLSLFSLAGIPPFAGFFSKFFIFMSAFRSGFHLLVFIALVNTVISLYYYLLIVKAMYINKNETPVATFRSDAYSKAGMIICLIGIIGLGIASIVYETINQFSFGI
jgi:NADH-quinone oxidoreductase subunit N